MKAVIFDMDGVISDTQILHSHTESELFKEHGIDIHPDEITKRFAGVSDNEAFPKIFREAGKELQDFAGFVRKKWERMFAAPPEKIIPMPGVLEILDALHQKNVPLAVASGSALPFVEHVLTSLNIQGLFSAVVSADEVENGKPAPDIFLLAAKRLGAEPANCVVIEDGLAGMQAARAAGMRCVALLTHVNEAESPAEVKVHSFNELSIDTILE